MPRRECFCKFDAQGRRSLTLRIRARICLLGGGKTPGNRRCRYPCWSCKLSPLGMLWKHKGQLWYYMGFSRVRFRGLLEGDLFRSWWWKTDLIGDEQGWRSPQDCRSPPCFQDSLDQEREIRFEGDFQTSFCRNQNPCICNRSHPWFHPTEQLNLHLSGLRNPATCKKLAVDWKFCIVDDKRDNRCLQAPWKLSEQTKVTWPRMDHRIDYPTTGWTWTSSSLVSFRNLSKMIEICQILICDNSRYKSENDWWMTVVQNMKLTFFFSFFCFTSAGMSEKRGITSAGLQSMAYQLLRPFSCPL